MARAFVILDAMLQWQNTDQFGNLKVAVATGTSLEDIFEDLDGLAEAVFTQHSENVQFSIDVPYGEIAAPSGDQVSHILQIPFLADLVAGGASESSVYASIHADLSRIVGPRAEVRGPWD